MNIEQRLARVERQNRIFKGIFNLAGLAVAALIFYGATKPIPDVIRAREFQAVNEAGRVVVEMKSWELGGWIKTYSAMGTLYSSVLLSHDGSGHGSLSVYDKDGNRKIYLGGNKRGNGGVIFIINEMGAPVVRLRVDEYGNGLVGAYSRKGEGRTLKPGP